MRKLLIVLGVIGAGVVALFVVACSVALIEGEPEPKPKKAGPTKAQVAKKVCRRSTRGAENIIALAGNLPLGKEYESTLKSPDRSPFRGKWAARCKATVNYVSDPDAISGGRIVTTRWIVEKRPGKWEAVGSLKAKTIPD